MCRKLVTIESMDHAGNVTIRRDDDKSYTVGEEGWCSIARYYGWKACTMCDSTDGSVDCEHHTTSEMLARAGAHLSEHVGQVADDPGWWD